jgi:RNA polymerase sigma factor (sigma-70 family)
MSAVATAEPAFRPSVHLRLSSDARLARLAGEGDGQAFATIFERYHQPLYRYCRSIVRDPDDASDALQSTMANALRALSGPQTDVALRSWLFRIAHNEAVSILRRRRPHQELEEDTAAPLQGSPQDALERREELAELVGALRELPSRQRGALVMRELNGLAYEEIGTALEISAGAAKQTVYEARRTLHEHQEGRAMSCEPVRRSVSAGDRRLLRGRRVRAHLRHCTECREFDSHVNVRRAKLAALCPPLETASAAKLLSSVLGGEGMGGGGVLAGVGGGALASSAPAAALTALVVVVVGAGAATAAIVQRTRSTGGEPPGAAVARGVGLQPPVPTPRRAPRVENRAGRKHVTTAERSASPRSVEPRRSAATEPTARPPESDSSQGAGPDSASLVARSSPSSGPSGPGSSSGGSPPRVAPTVPLVSTPAPADQGAPERRPRLPVDLPVPALPTAPALPLPSVGVPDVPVVPQPPVQSPVDAPAVPIAFP